MRLQLRHTLACSAREYWEDCVLSPSHNEGLFRGELKFARYDVVRQDDLGDEVHREVIAEPNPDDIPALVRGAMGSMMYRERGHLYRPTSSYVFATEMPGSRLVRVSGTMACVDLGDTCERMTVLEIDAPVPFLRGTVESKLAEDLRRAYDRSATFAGEWCAAMRRSV